ncbi:hypothetical protein [Pseudomonas sp. Irchel 3E13]|uniref:hypothetical protein n=1 Tax=Pseudomonas sp. Irchel 3E13 TaxID=2008975 RepID=UPI000BA33207|nr:hypothetical protein [Pseudomonas sp. Irchel 3E13]
MNRPHPDYQEVLQTFAMRYLQRHQAEHLSGDNQLFVRTVGHLVADHNVSVPTAQKAVHLAMTDLALGTADSPFPRIPRT